MLTTTLAATAHRAADCMRPAQRWATCPPRQSRAKTRAAGKARLVEMTAFDSKPLQTPPTDATARLIEPSHAMPRRRFLLGAIGVGAFAAGLTGPHAQALADPKPQAPALAKGAAAYHGHSVRYADFVQRRTGERFRGVYFEQGRYLPDALNEVDWVLRDDHIDEVALMDLRLVDLMSDIRESLDGHEMIVTSGYRSLETNNRLRRTSGAVKNSLHRKGMAVDFYSPQLSVSRLARLAASFEAGGVGRYDRRGFVHVDVGDIRYWRG